MNTIHTKVAVTCNMILNILEESSDSDSSDEDELLLLASQSCLRQKLIPRTKRYMEGTIYLMTDVTFKSHFRMRRDTFTGLLQMIGERLNKQSVRYGRNPIPPEKQLLLALWTMATPDSYRSISDRFDVGKATGWRTVRRVVDALYRLRTNVIKWPDAMTAKKTWEYILNKYGFPKVLGAVDGTHIKIAAPKINHEAYINRKGFHSIQLQVVCDEHLRLIHAYAGEVGSVHDARVFRLSGLQNYCSPDYFPEDSHLLGDAAYGIQRHVMVPYKCHAHLEAECVRYNAIHSSSRIMIERSIGLLKGRFRSLMDVLPMKRTDLIPRYIIACCVLHNICINANDLIDIPIILNDEVIRPLPREVNDNTRFAGIQKRDSIKCQLSVCH